MDRKRRRKKCRHDCFEVSMVGHGRSDSWLASGVSTSLNPQLVMGANHQEHIIYRANRVVTAVMVVTLSCFLFLSSCIALSWHYQRTMVSNIINVETVCCCLNLNTFSATQMMPLVSSTACCYNFLFQDLVSVGIPVFTEVLFTDSYVFVALQATMKKAIRMNS